MHAMEEKGQGWLASRASATSLSPRTMTGGDDRYEELSGGGGDGVVGSKTARSMPASRYGSRAQSRTQSRVQSRITSRVGSRVDLSMTSQLHFSPSNPEDGAAPTAQDFETMEPDFVDLDNEPDDGIERYEVVDEGEMRVLVWGRFGDWVDWAVGWMDMSVDDGLEEGDDEDYKAEVNGTGTLKARRKSDRIDEEERAGIKAPRTGGIWEDAKWLLKVVGHSV